MSYGLSERKVSFYFLLGRSVFWLVHEPKLGGSLNAQIPRHVFDRIDLSVEQ